MLPLCKTGTKAELWRPDGDMSQTVYELPEVWKARGRGNQTAGCVTYMGAVLGHHHSLIRVAVSRRKKAWNGKPPAVHRTVNSRNTSFHLPEAPRTHLSRLNVSLISAALPPHHCSMKGLSCCLPSFPLQSWNKAGTVRQAWFTVVEQPVAEGPMVPKVQQSPCVLEVVFHNSPQDYTTCPLTTLT